MVRISSVYLAIGDCIEQMAAMDEASVDAIVTDPPYLIGFMGKEFDSQHRTFVERKSARRAGSFEASVGNHNPTDSVDAARTRRSENQKAQAWHTAWATEALRVLKPGGHLLAFGGTRTYHRLACAVEDAGFEIRDCIAWLYGSGFPKSLDVSKAIDKAAGVEREVIGRYVVPGDSDAGNAGKIIRSETSGGYGNFATAGREGTPITTPATEAAHRWNGWGTALKPAFEPIVVARKPLIGTVAQNVERYGTGAINVDGCRVEHGADVDLGAVQRQSAANPLYVGGAKPGDEIAMYKEGGRWPANVVLDESAGEMLDEQSGESRSAGQYVKGAIDGLTSATYDDSGGASRFYYTAKASRAERNAGLEGFARNPREWQNLTRNHHPTVKPIALMRWLVRLVTPPGGTVLDPFTGSGTTGIAAVLEGFDFIGIEREPEYAAIAEARIAFWREHGEKALLAMYEAERRREIEEVGQLNLLGEAT